MEASTHPGPHIRKHVLPTGVTVKKAAELLGVGRPALSNLLNGNAALSSEMAERLERAFGASKEELLEIQSRFDQARMSERGRDIAVRSYAPSFLKITAGDIETWAENQIARTLLPVLLRKLIRSTGLDLKIVDFPGYGNSERPGWDGLVEAGRATIEIPAGVSRWECGCDKSPRQKAENDFVKRTKTVPAHERASLHFVFVTPRKWLEADKWAAEKRALGGWKSVRAYDASNLEQWLETSIPAQAWLAEEMGRLEGIHSLEDQWRRWVCDTQLPKELFATSVQHYRKKLRDWLDRQPLSPFIVCGDSKEESLAFLSCLLGCDEFASRGCLDRTIVFTRQESLRKVAPTASNIIPIVFTDDLERELGDVPRRVHTIVVRPKNSTETKPDIVLEILSHTGFRKAAAAMGVGDRRADSLARESGRSPTILRRRLSNIPAIKTPIWTQDAQSVRHLIPMMLVGTWHADSKGDREIMQLLSADAYPEVERRVARMLEFDDSPIWSIGRLCGVVSKLDSLFAVRQAITATDLENFLLVAEIVLSEKDPALDLPEDQRWAANVFGKTREHSGVLRAGICETLVLLAVHGNDLFQARLGIDAQSRVNRLIRCLLTPLTPVTLLSQRGDLPLYAEAAPDEFLRILNEDLRSPAPAIHALLGPAGTGIMGSGCHRTGLLWALEGLAWNPDRLDLVAGFLAKLAEREIKDNWANKPDGSLASIFHSWLPQTAASLDERKTALETLTKRAPKVGWRICLQNIERPQSGRHSYRPRWRNDAVGAGEPVPAQDRDEFERKALELAIDWQTHDANTLGDLVERLQPLPSDDQRRIWGLVEEWAKSEQDEYRRAALRERIRRFALSRRSRHRNIGAETRDRAREVYAQLEPRDILARIQWLFAANWVEESSEDWESEGVELRKHGEKIRRLRVDALQEIWTATGFEGIYSLLNKGDAAGAIGRHMSEVLIETPAAAQFITQCLSLSEQALDAKVDALIACFLLAMNAEGRAILTRELAVILKPDQVCRLLKCSPFGLGTWLFIDQQLPETKLQYWREVQPGFWLEASADLNEGIDRLLDAKRPRTAFHTIHLMVEEAETSRLKRLLDEMAKEDNETTTVPIDSSDVSAAMDILQKRTGVTEEEMARLEFQYIRVLDHTEHGIPNLERQLCRDPSLFMHALALAFKRGDGGLDPPEWNVEERKQSLFLGAYDLLQRAERIPGTQDDNSIDLGLLRTWIREARSLCQTYGRAVIGDEMIGRMLSAPRIGDDGVWPCEAVREALEEVGSHSIAEGLSVGVYNSRGTYLRTAGGSQDRDLAQKYRAWSQHLRFGHPYVARLVADIAASYDRDAARDEAEAVVRHRLEH